MPLLGAHLSISGGFHKALLQAEACACQTVQLFVSQPKAWPVTLPPTAQRASSLGEVPVRGSNGGQARDLPNEEVQTFRRVLRKTGLRRPMAHGSYLINLASPDDV